jgi:hypothetical protein
MQVEVYLANQDERKAEEEHRNRWFDKLLGYLQLWDDRPKNTGENEQEMEEH